MYLSKQKSNWLLALALCMGAGFAALPAAAQQHADHHVKQKWPQATLQAEANAEIAQDTVKITLAAELSDATQTAVADALTKTLEATMKQAKEGARGKADIKVSSGNYRIWPMNDKEGKITNWRGRAEIFLESTDFVAASELAASVSDRMPVSDLRFSVSPQQRAKQEEALLAAAAQAFRDRAQALADAFGFASYSIKEINLGGSGARYESAPAPRMMAMAADKASSVPLEGGTEMVSVSINGSIFLHSAQK